MLNGISDETERKKLETNNIRDKWLHLQRRSAPAPVQPRADPQPVMIPSAIAQPVGPAASVPPTVIPVQQTQVVQTAVSAGPAVVGPVKTASARNLPDSNSSWAEYTTYLRKEMILSLEVLRQLHTNLSMSHKRGLKDFIVQDGDLLLFDALRFYHFKYNSQKGEESDKEKILILLACVLELEKSASFLPRFLQIPDAPHRLIEVLPLVPVTNYYNNILDILLVAVSASKAEGEFNTTKGVIDALLYHRVLDTIVPAFLRHDNVAFKVSLLTFVNVLLVSAPHLSDRVSFRQMLKARGMTNKILKEMRNQYNNNKLTLQIDHYLEDKSCDAALIRKKQGTTPRTPSQANIIRDQIYSPRNQYFSKSNDPLMARITSIQQSVNTPNSQRKLGELLENLSTVISSQGPEGLKRLELTRNTPSVPPKVTKVTTVEKLAVPTEPVQVENPDLQVETSEVVETPVVPADEVTSPKQRQVEAPVLSEVQDDPNVLNVNQSSEELQSFLKRILEEPVQVEDQLEDVVQVEGGAPPPPPPAPDAEGGAPPPPPPPGADSQVDHPTGPKHHPLTIEKIAGPKIRGTVWEQLQDEDREFQDEDLESQLRVAEVKHISIAEREAEERKNSPLKILDPKRAEAIEVLLKRFDLDATALKEYIMSGGSISQDEFSTEIQGNGSEQGALILNQLKFILHSRTATQEEQDFRNFQGELESPVEIFMKELYSIPNLGMKMECVAFRSDFAELKQDAKKNMKLVNRALDTLAHPAFLRFLTRVRSVANYINKDNFARNAKGFQLSSLTKLSQVKTKDNNLLIHVVTHVEEEDLSYLASLEPIWQESVKGVVVVETLFPTILAKLIELDRQIATAPQNDEFVINMKHFSTQIMKFVEDLSTQRKEMDKRIRYYGGNDYIPAEVQRETDAFTSLWEKQRHQNDLLRKERMQQDIKNFAFFVNLHTFLRDLKKAIFDSHVGKHGPLRQASHHEDVVVTSDEGTTEDEESDEEEVRPQSTFRTVYDYANELKSTYAKKSIASMTGCAQQ
eukprot:TRINITY_DN349_c0_g1_i2.p1 TRINITY_DN349_c0_g1~~TRINITY_DN349_c0_g1_i2.p1  ORF type:complete len:1028 (-),score=434.43 TRINITY_DN349_c0_g1_i2:142-3225(-)